MAKHFLVDSENQRLTFTDLRFYLHKESGNWFPSVSTILDAYPKSAQFFQWLKENGDTADSIRDEAADTGGVVHHLTELYDKGEEVNCLTESGNVAYSSLAWAMFERYVEFSERFSPEILDMEVNMVSPELGFGGTRDRLIVLDGKKLLIDIKTSNALHNHYWLQMAAYVKLYEKLTGDKVDGIAILWLKANPYRRKERTNSR
jgi:hypothetical protein